MKARRLPGVRCSTANTECRSLLCLMIMPGRSCVAGIDIARNSLLQNKCGVLSQRKGGQATFSAAQEDRKGNSTLPPAERKPFQGSIHPMNPRVGDTISHCAQAGLESLRRNHCAVACPTTEVFRYKETRLIMRFGRYESSEGNNVGTAVTFFLIGLGAGALVALALAPKTGKQFRRDLKRGYEDARETLQDWTEEAKDRARDARERVRDVAERGADMASDLGNTVREKVEPLRRAVNRG